MEKNYDVAIIGGGTTGISTAYVLAGTGKTCAVFEKNTIGSGATAKTTAFLTNLLDTSLVDLKKIFGQEKAKLVWQSHAEAIDTIEHIVNSEHIDCSFMRCPSYNYANSTKDFEGLTKDYQLAKELGFDVELHKNNNFPFNSSGYMILKNQAKFYLSHYVKALAQKAQQRGAFIFEHREIKEIQYKDGIWKLNDGASSVFAKDVVIATYYPFGRQTKTHFKKGMYVSYVFKLQIPKNYLPYAIFEDTANPYHYFRTDDEGDHDSMIIGGQDHRADIPLNKEKNFIALEKWIQKTFTSMKYTIKSRWTGPILEPSDGLALIGKIKDHLYVATAFSGNGITYSTITAQIVSDLIENKKNPYAELYDPTRFLNVKSMLIKGRDYASENWHTIFGT